VGEGGRSATFAWRKNPERLEAKEPPSKEKKTHHEGHEVHEEKKLTTKGAKAFNRSEPFVAFVIFVVSISFVKCRIHDE
jgi:hypothetical protein